MKDYILIMLSRFICENSDWFLSAYSGNESVLKDLIYRGLKARKNPDDRKLADLLYAEFLKVPEERRKFAIARIAETFLNYMTNKSRNYVSTIIDVNSTCNLNCKNCANSAMNCSNSINWSLQEINDVVKALHPYTRLLFVSGGEPYMNPNLIDAIEENQGFEFVTFTNGSMTTQYEKAVEKDLANLFVMVSIDGTEEYHDSKRGKGVFKNAENTVKFFRSHGYLCGVSSVVEPGNIDYLFSPEYIDFVRSLNASALYLLKDAHNPNISFNKKYYDLSRQSQNTLFSTFPVINMPYCEGTLSKDQCCFAGRQWFRINANFEATACPFSTKTYGNVHEDSCAELVRKLKSNLEPPKEGCGG